MTTPLQNLSADQLLAATHKAVRTELLSTAEVVKCFQEISQRKLYLERGFSSLFEMATRHFGYCAASAQRRIQSMRLVQDLPEVEVHLESGELTLTAAASLQSFFFSETKLDQEPTREEKLEAVQACLHKSTRDVERELAKRNPQAAKRETTRVIAEDRLSLHFSISRDLDERMSRLKALLSHRNPKMGNEELLEVLVDMGLEKLDPVRKARRHKLRKQKSDTSEKSGASEKSAEVEKSGKPDTSETSKVDLQKSPRGTRKSQEAASGDQTTGKAFPAPEIRSRHILSAEKATVWERNNDSGCEYVDGVTGQRCRGKHFLQVDHVVPFSYGGASTADNLRVLCSQHNRFAWAARPQSSGRGSRANFESKLNEL